MYLFLNENIGLNIGVETKCNRITSFHMELKWIKLLTHILFMKSCCTSLFYSYCHKAVAIKHFFGLWNPFSFLFLSNLLDILLDVDAVTCDSCEQRVCADLKKPC